jgi:hypothetical protein
MARNRKPGSFDPGSPLIDTRHRWHDSFSYTKAGDVSNTPGPARALRRALALATEPALKARLVAAISSLEGRRP